MMKKASLPLFILFALLFTPVVHAEDGDLVEHGFYHAAEDYAHEAAKFRKKGEHGIADLYARMSQIKRHAGQLADQGRWDDIDWSEYQKLEKQLDRHFDKHKKHDKSKYKL